MSSPSVPSGAGKRVLLGGLVAFWAFSLWAVIDLLGVVAAVEVSNPGALVLFLLVVSAVVALLLGVTAGLLSSELVLSTRLGFTSSFVIGGLIVLGTAINRTYLPSPWHPISLITDAAVVIVLGAGGGLLSRLASRAGSLTPGTCVAVVVWLCAYAVAAGGPTKVIRFGGHSGDFVPSGTRKAGGERDGNALSRNVLVVVVDSLRSTSLYSLIEEGSTPTFGRLGNLGARFTEVYAQSSWTKPSVATMFTGYYPGTHGAEGRNDVLAAEFTTLPEVFAASGYQTGVFSANPWVSPTFGFDQGVTHFVESEPGGDPSRLLAIVRALQASRRLLRSAVISAPATELRRSLGLLAPHRSNCQRDAEIVGSVLSWIKGHSGQPFFAYVHMMSTHLPYEPPGRPPRVDPARQLAAQRGRLVLSETEKHLLREDYEATVKHADRQVGRLISGLAELGLQDRTLFLLAADHGDELYEHTRLGHGKTLYPEVVRIPLIAVMPGVIPAGAVIRERISEIDLAPTILDLAGLPIPPGIPGHPVRFAPRTGGERQTYVYLSLKREGGLSIESIIDGSYQYIESAPAGGRGEARRELYDLSRDPGAMHNLWDPGSRISQRMAGALEGVSVRARRRGSATKAHLSEETKARLRSLGYAD